MKRIALLGTVVIAVAAFAALAGAPPAAPAPAPAPAAPPTPAPAAGPKTYKLDPSSSLIVRTWKDGAAATLAHDHAIRATEFSGEATWDPAAPENTKVEATAKTATMLVDDDKDRAAAGVDISKPVPEKDRKAVDDTLKSDECLNVKKFPTITFKSTKMEKGADGKLTLTGDFTLHGVTHQVKIPVNVDERDGKLVGTGSFKLKTSDYGIKPYSAFLGAVKVKDEVEIKLKLVGVPK